MPQISSLSSRPQSTQPVKSRTNIMSPIDREIEQLINQKGIIHEKIASIKSDEKLESKQKDERIKLLTMDLQLLESQIMQKRMEKTEENKNDNSASSKKENLSKRIEIDAGKQDVSGISMEKFLQASNLHDQLTKMASVRRSLKVETDTLRHEVRKGRELLGGENEPGDPGKSEMRKNLELTVNKSKTEEALNIEKKITELDRKISEKIEATKESIQNDENKVITGEVDNQEDVSLSDQPESVRDTIKQNQDTDKNMNTNRQAQQNISIDIRV
ncbi:hypothetical protein M4D81_10530 [Paenibacillus sp. p3-SID867]|uniref:hypothetical protein n=1 Tax=Paenibacillus sp. p3-SID867 TaxID=2916363 RepID=UPI0021A96C22|nr:hypothetical protein [Paenibacillus sp. p3-SID867]MCT1399455.1 hypothetical protein [Paenibacillus sp. p3-SID867]